MVFRSEDAPSEVSVNTASLDDPSAFAPQKHIFAQSRIPWFHTRDELPSYSGSAPVDRRI
jgi:hypothetical protein